jgi:hypothetical protein
MDLLTIFNIIITVWVFNKFDVSIHCGYHDYYYYYYYCRTGVEPRASCLQGSTTGATPQASLSLSLSFSLSFSPPLLLSVCGEIGVWTLPPELWPSPFVLFSHFQVGSWVFAWVGLRPCSPIYALPHGWDNKCVLPCRVYWLRWGPNIFCPGWLWTMILPISASWMKQ